MSTDLLARIDEALTPPNGCDNLEHELWLDLLRACCDEIVRLQESCRALEWDQAEAMALVFSHEGCIDRLRALIGELWAHHATVFGDHCKAPAWRPYCEDHDRLRALVKKETRP